MKKYHREKQQAEKQSILLWISPSCRFSLQESPDSLRYPDRVVNYSDMFQPFFWRKDSIKLASFSTPAIGIGL